MMKNRVIFDYLMNNLTQVMDIRCDGCVVKLKSTIENADKIAVTDHCLE
jgi:hypothetical protein